MIFADKVQSAVTREECEALAAIAKDKVVLEMGSWLGRSTIAMASVAQAVHSVDTHKNENMEALPNSFEEFVKNLESHGVKDKVHFYVGRFEDVVPRLKGPFDVVFIDGDHTLRVVARDTDLALKALTPPTSPYPRGVLAFHDYGLKFIDGHPESPFGVTEVVDNLSCSIRRPVKVIGTLAILEIGS